MDTLNKSIEVKQIEKDLFKVSETYSRKDNKKLTREDIKSITGDCVLYYSKLKWNELL